jgi:TolA-binding protein
MLNSRNLHAGLELEWGETSIDKLSSSSSNSTGGNTSTSSTSTSTGASSGINKLNELKNNMNKSFYEQESWVVQLPSVLFICLNRYKFVKATQSSSKILEPFEFYPHIYLDRYMYTNREVIRAKRKELKQLNTELRKFEEKLNSIKNYQFEKGSECTSSSIGANTSINSHKEYCLDDVLKCTLHFVSTDYSSDEVFSKLKPIRSGETGVGETSMLEKDQLNIVQNCLVNWIKQITQKIKELESSISEIKNKIDTIYDEESLKKIKYNLHSVCIHEGNASSGHFWTYIWNPKQLKWYKYNDTEVCETSWDDLFANAVGGANLAGTGNGNSCTIDSNASSLRQLNTEQDTSSNSCDSKSTTSRIINDRTPSAYFLIYAKAEEAKLYQEANELDEDLEQLLIEDNEILENQLNQIKLKYILRECVEKLKKSNSEITILSQNNSGTNTTNENNQTCIEHAKAFADSTFETFVASYDKILPNKGSSIAQRAKSSSSGDGAVNLMLGAEEALKYALDLELNKYAEIKMNEVSSKLPDNDMRIQHIVTYFGCNNLSRELKIIALYDIFRMLIFSENDIKLKILQTLAQIKYNEYIIDWLSSTSNSSTLLTKESPKTASTNPELIKIYEKWQADYRDYRSIIAAFINAVNFMDSHRFFILLYSNMHIM